MATIIIITWLFQINLEQRPLNKLTTASAKSEAFLNKCYSRPVSALPTLNFDKVNPRYKLNARALTICVCNWQMDDSDNRSDRPFSAGYQPKKFRYLTKNYNESSLESLDGSKVIYFLWIQKIAALLNTFYRRHPALFQLVQESLFGTNKKLDTWQQW